MLLVMTSSKLEQAGRPWPCASSTRGQTPDRASLAARRATLKTRCCLLHQSNCVTAHTTQVVNLHYMLSKASVKARPSVLWCYKKELALSRCACGWVWVVACLALWGGTGVCTTQQQRQPQQWIARPLHQLAHVSHVQRGNEGLGPPALLAGFLQVGLARKVRPNLQESGQERRRV
jgi:hypothetical protein